MHTHTDAHRRKTLFRLRKISTNFDFENDRLMDCLVLGQKYDVIDPQKGGIQCINRDGVFTIH